MRVEKGIVKGMSDGGETMKDKKTRRRGDKEMRGKTQDRNSIAVSPCLPIYVFPPLGVTAQPRRQPCFNIFRSIFPRSFFGSEATNAIQRGYL